MNKVSVIIPVYNSSCYLDEALKSVFAQKMDSFEVIVIDDGSEPEEFIIYKDIVSKYSYIKLFKKENGGAASARNFGAQMASGDYIAFLDSDDIWLPGKIDSQLSIIKSNDNIALVLGNVVVADESLNLKFRSAKILPRETRTVIEHFFEGRIVMNTPTILVRKDVFNSVGGFCEDLLYREDHYFLMNIAEISNIICDSNFLTVRRERAGSLSSVKDVNTEFEKHLPFWNISYDNFPFLNVKRAKLSLLFKLYVYYLRNDRTDDLNHVIKFSQSYGIIYIVFFKTFKNMSWLIKLLYNIRSLKNSVDL